MIIPCGCGSLMHHANHASNVAAIAAGAATIRQKFAATAASDPRSSQHAGIA